MTSVFTYIDRKSDGTPFYVGVGSKRRMRKTERNWSHTEVINSDPHWTREVIETGELSQCLELEAFIIGELGRKDLNSGILTNLNDGGTGNNNTTFWDSVGYRDKMSAIHKAERATPTGKQRLSECAKRTYSDPGARKRQSLAITSALSSLKKPPRIKKRVNYPDHFTQEQREAYRVAQNNPELKTHLSKLRANMVWVNNGKVTTRIQSEQLEFYLSSGWKKGRK